MTGAGDSTPAQASVRAPQAHGLPRSLVAHPVARKLAVPDLTTTVLTMTLTGLGADLRAVLRSGATHATARSDLIRRLLATTAAGAAAAAARPAPWRTPPAKAQ